jgi:hypothetical protein
MQKWKKLGKILNIDKNSSWMNTHSAVPVAINVKDDLYKIFFATRDKDSHAQIAYIVIDINNPKEILEISLEPILKKGKIGCFDDEGVFPTTFVKFNNNEYLYYVGWNNHSINGIFQTSAGIAKKEKNKFIKLFDGPILDRGIYDPTLIATYDIIYEDKIFKMWYTSGLRWEYMNGNLQSFYHIKYAESLDGINWQRDGHICIDFESSNESNIGRPTVIKENGLYKMWYCYALINQLYRIGYAESKDGFDWIRKDKEVGVSVSENGWDSEMIAYPNVFIHNNKKYMLYCGNGYGKEGFGIAVLDE